MGTSGNASTQPAWRRPGKKALVAAAGVLVVGSGLGLSIAAGGAPSGSASLRCDPSSVQIVQSTRHGHDNHGRSNGTCDLSFRDGSKLSGYGGSSDRGRKVCFSTAAPNTVSADRDGCTYTDHGGRASATFEAFQAGTATVTATESIHGTTVATVSVSIPVTVTVHDNKAHHTHN